MRARERSLSLSLSALQVNSRELPLLTAVVAWEKEMSAQAVSLFLGEREREIVFNLCWEGDEGLEMGWEGGYGC